MGGRYILVVEDEDLVQMLLASHLQEFGFEVTTAGSAAEAKEKIQLLGSVVVGAIIDMSLRDAQGDRLLGELRIIHPHLAAVIARDDVRARVPPLGAEPPIKYLEKPFSRQQLRDALRELGVEP